MDSNTKVLVGAGLALAVVATVVLVSSSASAGTTKGTGGTGPTPTPLPPPKVVPLPIPHKYGPQPGALSVVLQGGSAPQVVTPNVGDTISFFPPSGSTFVGTTGSSGAQPNVYIDHVELVSDGTPVALSFSWQTSQGQVQYGTVIVRGNAPSTGTSTIVAPGQVVEARAGHNSFAVYLPQGSSWALPPHVSTGGAWHYDLQADGSYLFTLDGTPGIVVLTWAGPSNGNSTLIFD